MRQKTIYKEIFWVMIAVILVSSNVLAFAVSSQYYERNPLYLQSGESAETFFTLQNLASEEDITLQARIIAGEDIIELTDSSDIYVVPAGEKTKVNFIVTAPADAKKGDSFPITIMFATITGGEGPIALSGSIGKGFNLAIGEPSDFEAKKKTKFSPKVIYGFIGVVLIVIAFLIIRKKFSKSNSRDKKKTNKF